MTDTPTLATALEAILDGVYTLLEAARATDGDLEGILKIHRGGVDQPKPPPPVVMYWPDRMDRTTKTFGLVEEWVLALMVAGVVQSDDVTQGATLANDYTAKARGVLLKNQHLGNPGLAYVKAVTSTRFEPNGPMHRKGPLYAALAVVEIRFLARL